MTGQKTEKSTREYERRQTYKHITDLDTATAKRAVLNREKSENHAIFRPTARGEKENDEAAEALAFLKKISSEALDRREEDGSQFDLNLNPGASDSLCGVNENLDEVEASEDESPSLDTVSAPSISLLKTWKSSGKGKKRKNKVGNNNKHKRQRVEVSMSPGHKRFVKDVKSETVKGTCSSAVYKSDKQTQRDIQNITHKNDVPVQNPGNGKTSQKKSGGCKTAQKSLTAVVRRKECGKAFQGGSGDDGNGDDDGEGKPPRRPPEKKQCGGEVIGKKVKKKTKASIAMSEDTSEDSSGIECGEEKTPLSAPLAVPSSSRATETASSSDMEVDDENAEEAVQDQEMKSASPPPQQEPPAQQAALNYQKIEGLVVMLHGNINHRNFCRKERCIKCLQIKEMIQHCTVSTNCACFKCQLWPHVVQYHTRPGLCMKSQDCNVCKGTKKCLPSPAISSVVQYQVNISQPTNPPENEDERIIWKREDIPNLTHFQEDVHYIVEGGLVGKGGHGSVFNIMVPDHIKKKYFNSNSYEFVMKKVKELTDDEQYIFKQSTKHPNFVKTYCVVKKNDHYLIVMERCELSLKDYIVKLVNHNKKLQLDEAMFYWTQIFDVVKCLHHLTIPAIHKDVKAANVLLSIESNMVRVKLADFDTVKQLHNLFTQPGLRPKGTRGLISPEVLRSFPHGRPSDVWNMAMFLLQVMFPKTFSQLQSNLMELDIYDPTYGQLSVNFLKEVIPALKNMDYALGVLIEHCLNDEPSERPTANEVLENRAVAKYINQKIDMKVVINNIHLFKSRRQEV